MSVVVRKPSIPDMASLPVPLRERLEPIKASLEQVTGRRGTKIETLGRRANTGDLVNKVNELIQLLQDTESPAAGALASEWQSFTPAATGATSGSGTIVDNGCVWRLADRMVDILFDVTLSSAGTISGALLLSFPVEVPMPVNGMVYGAGRETVSTGVALTPRWVAAYGRKVAILRYDGATVATGTHRYTMHVRWPTA